MPANLCVKTNSLEMTDLILKNDLNYLIIFVNSSNF